MGFTIFGLEQTSHCLQNWGTPPTHIAIFLKGHQVFPICFHSQRSATSPDSDPNLGWKQFVGSSVSRWPGRSPPRLDVHNDELVQIEAQYQIVLVYPTCHIYVIHPNRRNSLFELIFLSSAGFMKSEFSLDSYCVYISPRKVQWQNRNWNPQES